MKKLKGAILFLICISVCFCIVSCSSVNKDDISNTVSEIQEKSQEAISLGDGTVLYPDGSMDLGEGSRAHGFYDVNHKYIDGGGIVQSVDNSIVGHMEVEQNINGKVDYLLIIMCDYVQQDFNVDGKSYSSYKFSLQDKSGISIPVDFLISDQTIEFEYLVFLNPDIKELSLDNWNDYCDTSVVFSNRFFINNYPKESNYTLDANYRVKENTIDNLIMITKSITDYTLMPECRSGDIVNLIFGDAYDTKVDCVLVAFHNWEQVPIIDEKINVFAETSPGLSFYYDIEMPDVNSTGNYQVIMLYMPFTPDYYDRLPIVSSFRTIIKK